MKTINIKETFKNDYISRAAGEKLRMIILETDKTENKITLDFDNLIIASTSFFDEGIAKLALEGWNQQKLESVVILKNLNANDLKVMQQMCAHRGLDKEK